VNFLKYSDNDERTSRLQKIGLAVTGITAGAFMLKDSSNLKYISKAIGDLGTTINKVSEDVSSKAFKELDYTTLKGIVKDSNSTWKMARDDSSIELDYGRGLLSSVLQYNKLKIDETYLKDEMFDSFQKNHVMTKLTESIGNQSSEFFGELTKLVDESLNSKNKYIEQNEDGFLLNQTEFNDRLKNSILEPKKNEIMNVMQEAINNSEVMRVDKSSEFNNSLKNNLLDSFKEEIINKYSNKEDTFFKNTLDRAATVKDLIDSNSKISNNELFEGTHNDIIDTLNNLVQEDARFNNLVIDNATLRVDKEGKLYSTKKFNDFKYNVKEEFADTIMGKLFSARSIVDNQKAPDFFYFAQGSYDSILGKLTGSESGILKNDFFKLGDNVYKYDNNELTKVDGGDKLYLMSGRHGSFNVFLNRIQGNIDKKVQDNKTLKWLDFNTTGVNFLDEAKGFFTKFDKNSSWTEHITGRIFDKNTYKEINEETAAKFTDDIHTINKLYNHRTFAPSKRALNEMKRTLSPDAARLLNALDEKNSAAYLLKESETYLNKDLGSLLNKYKKNISAINTLAQIGNLGDKNGMNILKYNDLLKREVVKEAFLRDAAYENSFLDTFVQGYGVSHNKLGNMNISGKDRKNLANIFNWGIIQKETLSFASNLHDAQDITKRTTIMRKFGGLLHGSSTDMQVDYFLKNFKDEVNSFMKTTSTWYKDVVIEKDNSIQKGYRNNQWVSMRKAVTPLDLIKSLNDAEKFKSTAKEFGKQFYAGRNNTNDITTLTFAPYHMLNRLITPMEKFGLGFSADNIGSVGALAKNLGLKRILPAIAIAYGASYANFESENLTGTSFTQDYYNFRANFGLGVKTIQQATGMSDNHRRSRMYNPIANYYLGDYKDKDEYMDYLENGYDPVRKGRWWSFGSASEFKGGRISYWEPNKLRQAYSHYKDVSLYGSEDEKWKHSLIPTPRHPLSTLRFLANPYWLEEKHYWDRPYPVTAPLFEEETPWGAVLNPTIGQLIKPVRRMHQAELKGSLLDVRSIIANHNRDIMNKAAENRVVRLDQSGFTPMDYHPNSMPSLNEAVYTVNFDNRGRVVDGGFEGEKYAGNMANVNHSFVPEVTGGSVNNNNINVQYSNVANTSGFLSTLLLGGLTRIVTSNVSSSNTAMGLIGGVNNAIKSRATANEFQSRGVINENAKLQDVRPQLAADNAKDAYLDKLNINDIGTKSDYVADLMYSGKQLAGMYGFLWNSIIPSKHGYQLENAGNMKSFVRSFWDNDLGGWGGDFMEIARRFFPHENHDIEQINPLRNTMPLWLPGRFQQGDPYTKVTKGEARLPGAGYETLNRLHPDKYGRYGAFDRYKILADVAPGSDEYKTWKKIAKNEIGNNPALKKQMDETEKRVKAQSSDHHFYNYQFLGKDMINKHAVIDTVTNTGKFTIVGSKQQYSIAGIKPMQDENKQSYIHEYLKSGMIVNLEYENNKFRNKDSQGNVVAIVSHGTENISKKMWEDKKAKEKDNKETLADNLFAASESNKIFGPVWEAAAHAQIPYLHNKYMRIDSPMESYKKEQIYGNNFSTWGHPLKGFVFPAFQTGWGKGIGVQALGLATWYWSNAAREKGLEGIPKFASHALFAFTNPYALVGGVIGGLPRMNWGSKASIWNAKNGANIAATVGLIGYGFAHLNNPLLSAANFGLAGYSIARQLKIPSGELPNLSRFLKLGEEEGKIIGGKEGAIFGAGIGLTLSAIKNPGFSLNKMFDKYIPGRVKKKWEMEEYFDRLDYIKYTNSYHQAARLAKKKEGVDINRIINKFDYNRDKNDKLIAKLQVQKARVEKYTLDENVKSKLSSTINAEIYKLQTPEQYYSMGKYTKAALAYKKAADTTIYGLTKYSSSADVLRALPKYDRDYFLEFANEKDPHERKKILKYISPYKAKALHVLWQDGKVKKEKSNKKFFSNHNLPNMFWSGWRPDVNLDNVKMKTIENEGMLLSDFGYYDSAKNEPAYQKAPEINNIHSAPSPMALQRDMLTLLNGVGLHTVDVSVEPSSASGLQIVTNIGRITQYNLQQKVQNALYKLF
jgi:hypothetical protein